VKQTLTDNWCSVEAIAAALRSGWVLDRRQVDRFLALAQQASLGTSCRHADEPQIGRGWGAGVPSPRPPSLAAVNFSSGTAAAYPGQAYPFYACPGRSVELWWSGWRFPRRPAPDP
jgi:hypothetical protein